MLSGVLSQSNRVLDVPGAGVSSFSHRGDVMQRLKTVLKNCEARGMASFVEEGRAVWRRAESRHAVLEFVAALEEIVNVLEPKLQRLCRRAEASGDRSGCEDAVRYMEEHVDEESRYKLYNLVDSFGCRLPDYVRFLACCNEDSILEVAGFAIEDPPKV